MTSRRWKYAAIGGVTIVSAIAGDIYFARVQEAQAVPDSIPQSSPYTPTPGFEYFPARYTNKATKIEDHIENF